MHGFVDIQLLDPASGARVDRTPGTTFEVAMPLPPAMQTAAPAEMPLWFFDEAAGHWFEESTATVDGTHCSGTLPHLSFWSCAVAAEDTRIGFAAAAAEQTHDVGDLCLDVPPVIIALLWSGVPQDLDSHLSVPTDPREHLYFANRPVSIAELDTDDTDGFGPEIVTIHELPAGTFRYSVHHYAGSSDMSQEGARALMLVEGQGIWRETPPNGGQGLNDVWQVWDFGTRKGKVNWVRPQRRVVESLGATDLSAFDPTESRNQTASSPISSAPEDFGF